MRPTHRADGALGPCFPSRDSYFHVRTVKIIDWKLNIQKLSLGAHQVTVSTVVTAGVASFSAVFGRRSVRL